MSDIVFLENSIREYAWGSHEFIARLLGRPYPTENPEAELWMGAHPGAPSKIIEGTGTGSIIDYIQEDPVSVLGLEAAAKFNNTLPFLFKVLAAEKPLSIQAHPDKKQAASGFARENSLNIPVSAPHRVYKDDNHKPEIILALTPFIALNGFRKADDIKSAFEKIGSHDLRSVTGNIGTADSQTFLKKMFYAVMTCPEKVKKRISADVVRFAESQVAEKGAVHDLACNWALSLSREYPGDIGILSLFFLNLVTLEPGEAMFLPAGKFHAYVHGAGMELMANSDNVLRGGLTPKHIDIPELLRIIDFSESPVEIIRPVFNKNHEKIYPAPSEEFMLSCISLKNGEMYQSDAKRSAEILLCTEGIGRIIPGSSGSKPAFKKGVSFLVPASIPAYTITGECTLYKAKVPV